MQLQSAGEAEPAGPNRICPPWSVSPLVLPVVYVAVCLLPLPLAAMEGYPLRSFLREFSSGLAMVGFAMALVQFALSGRFEWISGQTGIDRTRAYMPDA